MKAKNFAFIKNKLVKWMNKRGYDITKIDGDVQTYPIIKRDVLNPEKIHFLAESNKLPFICFVPVSYLNGHIMNFNFDTSNHPFKKAIKKALKKEKKRAIIKKELKNYYATKSESVV